MSIDVRLIGLDWGTSSLRAYLYDVDGNVVASRHQGWGIRQLPEGGFSAALRAITSDWPPCTTIAAGMVGSRQGWREVPYVNVPADATHIGHGLLKVDACSSHDLWIVPGVCQAEPANVMRGEETQIIGALARQPDHHAHAQFVLPGTHSKWATVVDSRIVAFDTVMTGEVYALLMKHSILGTGIPNPSTQAFQHAAFVRGLRAVKDSGAAGAFSRLFSARALMLADQLAVDDLPEFLSGLLIGEEFRIALLRDENGCATPLCLIGEAALCERYVVAASYFGFTSPTVIADAAAQGLWQLASVAGLLAQATIHRHLGVNA